jgi:hypothetical protein
MLPSRYGPHNASVNGLRATFTPMDPGVGPAWESPPRTPQSSGAQIVRPSAFDTAISTQALCLHTRLVKR